MMRQVAAVPESSRGSHLFQACESTVRFYDAGEIKGTVSDAARSNLCIGYLNGFLDALDAADVHAICIKNAMVATLARVYVVYMQKNPKLMDSQMAVGVSKAFVDAYPCEAPKK